MDQPNLVIPLGDVTIIWELCGSFGLCPKCREIDGATGCGARYQAWQVRSEAEEPYIYQYPHYNQDAVVL